MQLYHTIQNDHFINLEHIYKRKQLINIFKQRFSTYGFNEIYTPTFEPYDLYASMNGTVNHQEMMKIIDNTGKVLVLRPDITIPLTQKIAATQRKLKEELRYFYVLDVFRQAFNQTETREKTQAGVEYFGNSNSTADAEVIAIAIHTLNDLAVNNFKIELGHAGFFKNITKELRLAHNDLDELKQYIAAKNITELEPFLTNLGVNDDLQTIIKAIPFLYGKPDIVIKRAKQLPLTPNMHQKLDNLSAIYQILESYGVTDHVVIDLGLINHMDYYSDMIFQGFIEHVAHPVLMGGRYDELANQFNATIPAVGYACDIDLILDSVPEDGLSSLNDVTITIVYDEAEQTKGLQLANELRNQNYRVLTYSLSFLKNKPHSLFEIQLTKDNYRLITKHKRYNFTTYEELYFQFFRENQ